jgi:AmmeMemoRadiSam system protein B
MLAEGVLEKAPAPAAGQAPGAPKVLIVPHAGYVYSGSVAASAYRLLTTLRERIKRVVLVGPAHRVYFRGMAIPAASGFASPLGEVNLDGNALALLSDCADVVVSDQAHAQEHSLEVQLPFLQSVLDDFTLVPILVGDCTADRVAAALDLLWGGPETLIVISSDLSHFHSYEVAQRLDAHTSESIRTKSRNLTGEEACGAAAINGLMASHGAESLDVHTLDVRNSGDTAGDRARVVGYGAYALA